jgi:nitroimidazol reductase NimA-like FMN-containing flavoprotein (pyridoxamine 5'-phosphate oxidase superfamily)
VTDEQDPATITRAIIDANLYMVLGTADEAGQPWVSPVYYAPADYREFFWVSSPDSRHSRNLEGRGQVAIVIFDSSVPVGTGQGVYVSAVAQAVGGDERSAGIEMFSRRSLAHGGHAWTLQDVASPARLRLYRATAVEQFLGVNDRRVPVTL